jgi:hypothetical protein
MPKRAVRLSPDLDQQMSKAAKERGYRTPSAFIRAAIESEVRSRSELAGNEEQTAASFDRIARELRRIVRAQQAQFALLDALARAFLTCVPEPPSDARNQAIALGRDRYVRLIKSAGQAMASDAHSAMEDLLHHVKE